MTRCPLVCGALALALAYIPCAWAQSFPAPVMSLRNAYDFPTGVNPEDTRYAGGADPTGVRDSAPAINAALGSGSVKMTIPCGTFLLNATVNLPSNVEVAGNGACTILKPGPSIINNPQNSNVNLDPSIPALVSNADMQGGNSNIRVHNLVFDISTSNTGGKQVWGALFGRADNVRVYDNRFIGRASVGQDATAFVYSSNYSVRGNYATGMANTCYDNWFFPHNFDIIGNTCDNNNVGTGIFVNGIGLVPFNASTSLVSPAYNGIIANNTILNTNTGMLLTGLCEKGDGQCGSTHDLLVSNNTIDGVSSFHGIAAGDGYNDVIVGNKISNVAAACILVSSQQPSGGGIVSGYTIEGNSCSNINLSGGGNPAISVGTGRDVPMNFTIAGNNVQSAQPIASVYTFPFGIASDGAISTNTLTGTFIGTVAIGAIVSGAGVTGSPTITAATGSPPTSWTISGPSQGTLGPIAITASSQVITGFAIANGGYCTAVPTVVLTGGGGTGAAGTAVLSNGTTGTLTGITLTAPGSGYTSAPTVSFTGCNPPQYTYATRVNSGAINTSFVSGHEDAGSAGTDSIAGTLVPVTNYGTQTFPATAIYTDPALGIQISTPNSANESQIKFSPAGLGHYFQLGVGGIDDPARGVAGCAFLYDGPAVAVRWRICNNGYFNINPIIGTPAVATLDVNGTGRVAPGLFASLPACGATTEGMFATVTDGSTNTWGATDAGGGANHVVDRCNGTNWTVFAK